MGLKEQEQGGDNDYGIDWLPQGFYEGVFCYCK